MRGSTHIFHDEVRYLGLCSIDVAVFLSSYPRHKLFACPLSEGCRHISRSGLRRIRNCAVSGLLVHVTEAGFMSISLIRDKSEKSSKKKVWFPVAFWVLNRHQGGATATPSDERASSEASRSEDRPGRGGTG